MVPKMLGVPAAYFHGSALYSTRSGSTRPSAIMSPPYRNGSAPSKRCCLPYSTPTPTGEYYPARTRPNVEVVGAGLARVDGHSAIAGDGTARDVDVIILATGFRAVDMPIAGRITGADGVTLAQAWGGDMRALRGTTVPGFPNLCLVIGPNTGLGHS